MEKDETEGGDAFAYYFWAIAIFFFTLALLNFIVLLIIAHVLEISPSGMEAIEFMPGQGSVKFLKHLIGGFQLLDLIITELKNHMISYKFDYSHWWKIYFSKKSFTRFALQSECCNFNQREASNHNRSCDF